MTPPSRATRLASPSAPGTSGTKLRTRPDTTTSALAVSAGSRSAEPTANVATGSGTRARAAATKSADGSTPSSPPGAMRATICADSAPVPQPTSTQLEPDGWLSQARNVSATRRLHRPTYCS